MIFIIINLYIQRDSFQDSPINFDILLEKVSMIHNFLKLIKI